MCVLQTWGNRADAFVRQAELMAECNAGQSGEQASRQAYEQGMEAYATACSLTSSEQGDDLPGLLHNWGVGLRSMAEHTPVRTPLPLLDKHSCYIVCVVYGTGQGVHVTMSLCTAHVTLSL